MTRWPISYQLLGEAQEHYQKKYQKIEVPWVVPAPYTEATRPEGASSNSVVVDGKGDVGSWVSSAEQSFLQMMVEGKLCPDVQYMAISPCYRFGDNQNHDRYHFDEFMKLELFEFGVAPDFHRLMGDAETFFQSKLGDRVYLDIIGDGSIDLAYLSPDDNLIELGSYGTRTMELLGKSYTWAYGTGVAEPRLSQCLIQHEVPYESA